MNGQININSICMSQFRFLSRLAVPVTESFVGYEVSISSLLSLLLGIGLGGSWGWGGLGWGGLGWSSLSWSGLSWGGFLGIGLLGWGSWGLGWSWSWGWLWMGLLGGSLLLLQVLGEELLVGDGGLLGFNPSLLLDSLVHNLSSDSLLGDESLDAWRLVEGLVTSLDLSSNNVLSDIILSLSENESLSDVVGSLWSESSWSLSIGKSGDVLISLDENLEGNNGKIWATDASSGGLSLSLSGSSWSVESDSYRQIKSLISVKRKFKFSSISILTH